ncbi:hypothetical protein FALBO_10161 [Fusarium albosuccineum]|uniref:Mid2 domain-containing protein n=1 Tax=Fusarium albosuccineum TaxID=1237068 RepID=A0A8H4PIM7_9HYPO|nr:hypothetical protein FALBO_10161 [Fusarium albosuccineum]
MHLRIVIGLSMLLPAAAQQGVCWGVDGKQWTNNKKCPGSSACCGEGAICMSNRLCKNKGQGENEFVRGPCAVAPYDKKKCAAICIYEERNNRFPRVKRCDDGSYCCSNDDPGCCDGKRGTFLDSRGNIEAEEDFTTTTSSEATTTSFAPETSSTTSSTTATTTSFSEPSATSDETAKETNDPDAETTDNSHGMKIGLGVGIPAAAIIAALSVWLFLGERQSPSRKDPVNSNWSTPAPHFGAQYHPESDPRDRPDWYQQQLHQQQQAMYQQYPQMYQRYPETNARSDTKSPPMVQELQG